MFEKNKLRIQIKKYGWNKKLFLIKQNDLISKKHKKVSTTLIYVKQFLVLASKVTGCISIYLFD